jgi:predicted nuclease with RNAse H fold
VQERFLGVDIGGEQSTWICTLIRTGRGRLRAEICRPDSLANIVEYVKKNFIQAVCIDAPLTWSLGDKAGFRASDLELKGMLPSDCRNWVLSQNSLMAVPVRGQQLSEFLSPIIGTIIETHPRACLYFSNKSLIHSIKQYKKKDGQKHRDILWQSWGSKFGINFQAIKDQESDNALDSLVCSTIAYLFHYSPQRLSRLSDPSPNERGRGPFYVLCPNI